MAIVTFSKLIIEGKPPARSAVTAAMMAGSVTPPGSDVVQVTDHLGGKAGDAHGIGVGIKTVDEGDQSGAEMRRGV